VNWDSGRPKEPEANGRAARCVGDGDGESEDIRGDSKVHRRGDNKLVVERRRGCSALGSIGASGILSFLISPIIGASVMAKANCDNRAEAPGLGEWLGARGWMFSPGMRRRDILTSRASVSENKKEIKRCSK